MDPSFVLVFQLMGGLVAVITLISFVYWIKERFFDPSDDFAAAYFDQICAQERVPSLEVQEELLLEPAEERVASG